MPVPRQVQVLTRILHFYCKSMSPTLLTVKTYKYQRENPFDKFFPKNITWSPLPRFCIKNFLRETMFVTSPLRDADCPVLAATLEKTQSGPSELEWSLRCGCIPLFCPLHLLLLSLNFLPFCTLLSVQVATSLPRKREEGGKEDSHAAWAQQWAWWPLNGSSEFDTAAERVGEAI